MARTSATARGSIRGWAAGLGAPEPRPPTDLRSRVDVQAPPGCAAGWSESERARFAPQGAAWSLRQLPYRHRQAGAMAGGGFGQDTGDCPDLGNWYVPVPVPANASDLTMSLEDGAPSEVCLCLCAYLSTTCKKNWFVRKGDIFGLVWLC